MKILFIVGPNRLRLTSEHHKATRPFKVLRHMPCEVVTCTTPEDVKNEIGNADVILLAGSGIFIPFWDDIAKRLNSHDDILKCKYHYDSWGDEKATDGHDYIDVHYLLPSTCELAQVHWDARKRYTETPIFWMPPTAEIIDREEKQYDVVTWGRITSRYPIRQYVKKMLEKMAVTEVVMKKGGIRESVISMNGTRFLYRHIRNTAVWGMILYKSIGQARLCATGTAFKPPRCPLSGKYFENSAAGTMTLTNKFSDADALGFEDRHNIWFSSLSKVQDDLAYLLHNPSEMERISVNARLLIKERHTPEIRAMELYNFLCRQIGRGISS